MVAFARSEDKALLRSNLSAKRDLADELKGRSSTLRPLYFHIHSAGKHKAKNLLKKTMA